jgi:hypothetical protein
MSRSIVWTASRGNPKRRFDSVRQVSWLYLVAPLRALDCVPKSRLDSHMVMELIGYER